MFKRIDHVEIVTDRLDRTVQFYTDVLGFTVKARDRIERSGLGVPIDLVYLDLGGTVVELISYEGTAVDPAPQTEHLGYRMIALEVDDMQKTADYLRTKGNPAAPASDSVVRNCRRLCMIGIGNLLSETVIAGFVPPPLARHCEERRDEAISVRRSLLDRDCFASLAMTVAFTPSARV
jgi:glyoxylase I family protein